MAASRFSFTVCENVISLTWIKAGFRNRHQKRIFNIPRSRKGSVFSPRQNQEKKRGSVRGGVSSDHGSASGSIPGLVASLLWPVEDGGWSSACLPADHSSVRYCRNISCRQAGMEEKKGGLTSVGLLKMMSPKLNMVEVAAQERVRGHVCREQGF